MGCTVEAPGHGEVSGSRETLPRHVIPVNGRNTAMDPRAPRVLYNGASLSRVGQRVWGASSTQPVCCLT